MLVRRTPGRLLLLVLLPLAPLPAQLTWSRVGAPAPPAVQPFFPLFPGYTWPVEPMWGFWDETRNRAQVCFAQLDRPDSLPLSPRLHEFDGETWTGAAPNGPFGGNTVFDAHCPDPRGGGRQVRFGGLLNSFLPWNATSIYEPSHRAWTSVSPATAPSPRVLHSMALLPGIGAVLFGGQTHFGTSTIPSTLSDETWIWNGTDWRQVQTSTRPSARTWSTMTFDPVRAELLLFGGHDLASGLSDTWSFNGTRWLQLHPANTPPGGTTGHFVTDPVRRQIVLFGGTTRYVPGASFRNDTWTWDGANWTQRTPAHAPPPRLNAVTVWDPVSQRVLMLSGYTGGYTSLPDSWAWDGTDWTELPRADRETQALPTARAHATLAARPDGSTVLVGGDVLAGRGIQPLTDTVSVKVVVA